MKLFRISSDTIGDGYVYASGYGPLDTGMPFLRGVFLENMQAYWKINPEKPGLHIDPGRKRTWPDFLSCGNSPPLYFVSDRVVNSLTSAGVGIARLTEMPIAEIRGKAHKKIPPPKYYVVEADPGIEIDITKTGIRVDDNGQPILPTTYLPSGSPLFFRSDSWTGLELFSFKPLIDDPPPYDTLFCTDKIKALAETDAWTNVRFKPLNLT